MQCVPEPGTLHRFGCVTDVLAKVLPWLASQQSLVWSSAAAFPTMLVTDPPRSFLRGEPALANMCPYTAAIDSLLSKVPVLPAPGQHNV